MFDKIFELLNQQPILSISLGFVLAIVLAIVFRSVIADYIRKKYDLYTETDIRAAFIGYTNEKLGTLNQKNADLYYMERGIERLKNNN